MKRFVLVAVLGLAGAGIASVAEAGPLPRPVSFVDKASPDTRQSHYVRAPRKLPRPVSFVHGKARPYQPNHYVRTR